MGSPAKADIAIIGGGIIGLSIAWKAADAGFSVTVFDAGAMASESSHAGAGMLAPGGEAKQASGWAQDTVSARRLYDAFVHELQEATSIPIDYRACGGVDLAFHDDEWADLLQRRAVQELLGIRVEELPESTVRSMAPSIAPRPFRALHYPDDAVADPRDITRALQHRLASAGASLRPHSRVHAVTLEGGRAVLHGSAGEHLADADAAVLAAGAWAGSIELPPLSPAADAPRQAIPIRGHLLRGEQPAGALPPIVRHQHLYVFQRQRGELIAGSNEERVGFSREPNRQAVAAISQHVEAVLPGLLPAGEPDFWLGFRPGVEGDGPEVRRLRSLPVWLAYGHYRNGILLAPHTAERIAQELTQTFG